MNGWLAAIALRCDYLRKQCITVRCLHLTGAVL